MALQYISSFCHVTSDSLNPHLFKLFHRLQIVGDKTQWQKNPIKNSHHVSFGTSLAVETRKTLIKQYSHKYPVSFHVMYLEHTEWV